MNRTLCNSQNTKSFNDGCICYGGFYGTFCENHHEWYPILLIPFYVIVGLVSVICLIWTIILLVQKCKSSKNRVNLSTVSIILNLISMILRIILCLIPSRELYLNDPNPFYDNFINILGFVMIAIWVVTQTLIVGFWVIVIRRKIKKSFKTIRNISICFGALFGFISLFGISLSFIKGLNSIGGVIAVIPLYVMIVLITVFAIIFGRTNVSEISVKNQQKHRWVNILFILSAVNWIVYAILSVVIYLGNRPGGVPGMIAAIILDRICESFVMILNMLLFDYKLQSIKSEEVSTEVSTQTDRD